MTKEEPQKPVSDHLTAGANADSRRPRLPLPVRILLIVVGMAAAALSPALVSVLLPGLLADLESAPMATQVLVSIALWLPALLVYIAVGWLLTRGVDRRPMAEAGWRFDRRTLPGLLLGTVLSAGIVVAAVAVLLPTGRVESVEAPQISIWLLVLFTIARAFVLQGIGEELLWRGYGLQTMRDRPVRALLVTSLAFGAMHLVSMGGQQSIADHLWYLLMPLGFGFLAGVLALWTRSLWAAIGVHGGFHVGTTVATMLGWGIAGAPSWVVIGVAYVLVGVVILWRVPRALLASGDQLGPFDRRLPAAAGN